jgi:glyoxylase-like metal-dependent hydrolase (beta-lactamase superfamily II)
MFDDDLATLIDTGFDKHRDLTLRLVAHSLANHQQGQTARLARIINTHLHSDHCGANAALTRVHDCETLIPVACEKAVKTWDEDLLSFRKLRQRCEPFTADGTISPGDQFTAGGLVWDAHAAPGHDPTSLIFFAAVPRILISADAFWENGFGLIFPEIFGESGFAEQQSVLDLVESLNPATVLPGHGPIFTNIEQAMTVSRSRLAALQADPDRLHRTALKTLVTFTMLDVQRASTDEIVAMAEGGEVINASANALGMSLPDAISWATDQLVRQQVLRRDGQYLLNS